MVRKDKFDAEEEDFYEALYTQSQAQFGAYVQTGARSTQRHPRPPLPPAPHLPTVPPQRRSGRLARTRCCPLAPPRAPALISCL